jgi:hypothetical protein
MSERQSSFVIGGVRRVAIVIVLAGLLSLIANRLAPSPSTRALAEANSGPVLADVPAGPVCRAAAQSTPPTPVSRWAGLVTVDPTPVAVTAIWLPGFGAEPCAAQLTRGSAPLATRLAADIRAGQPLKGQYSCGPDDGTRAVLYFSYRNQRQAQIVRLSIVGCLDISAPGRLARQLGRLQPDLRPLAPPAFRQYTG